MAESVDALVSNTNGRKFVPVRSRLWVQTVKYPLCESVDYRADIFFLGGVADDFPPVADDFSFSRRWGWGSVDKGNF